LGAAERVGRLVISWADGRSTVIDNPPVNHPVRIAPPGSPLAQEALR
jgi:hypothetical protein